MWCVSYRLGSEHAGFLVTTTSCGRLELQLQECTGKPMESKLCSPTHAGKGSGWLFSKDPLEISWKRVRVADEGEVHHWPGAQSGILHCKAHRRECPSEPRLKEGREKGGRNAFLFLMLRGEGRKVAQKAGNLLRGRCAGPPLGADLPTSLIVRGLCLVPAAELQLRSCPRPSCVPGEGSDRRRSPET